MFTIGSYVSAYTPLYSDVENTQYAHILPMKTPHGRFDSRRASPKKIDRRDSFIDRTTNRIAMVGSSTEAVLKLAQVDTYIKWRLLSRSGTSVQRLEVRASQRPACVSTDT